MHKIIPENDCVYEISSRKSDKVNQYKNLEIIDHFPFFADLCLETPTQKTLRKLVCGMSQTTLEGFVAPRLEVLEMTSCSNFKIIPCSITLRILDVSSTSVQDIPDCLVNLEQLNVSYTAINIIPETLKKLKDVSCSFSWVSQLPSDLPDLISLDCCQTSITQIPFYPLLEYLDCSLCENVTELPEFPKLKTLSAHYTSIHSVVAPKLRKLTTHELEKYPLNLKSLNLVQGRQVPILPSLHHLDVSWTEISELPVELTELRTVNCRYTLISKIPKEYIKLKHLFYGGSKVSQWMESVKGIW